MVKLELEFNGFHNKIDSLYVDGKVPKLKKKDNGNRYCVIETDKPEVEVSMCKAHQYVGKRWFWWQLFCFIISAFGIFDMKQDNKCMVVDCRFKVVLKEDTKILIKRAGFVDGGEYITFDNNEKVNILTNKQFIDKDAQKKHAKMKKIKTATFISVMVVAGVLIVLL